MYQVFFTAENSQNKREIKQKFPHDKTYGRSYQAKLCLAGDGADECERTILMFNQG